MHVMARLHATAHRHWPDRAHGTVGCLLMALTDRDNICIMMCALFEVPGVSCWQPGAQGVWGCARRPVSKPLMAFYVVSLILCFCLIPFVSATKSGRTLATVQAGAGGEPYNG